MALDPAQQALLDEACDLTRAERLHLLVLDRDLGRKSHWEILGLRGAPSERDIKKAYFSLSKKYHPDTYFGRNTGSFAPIIARVFGGIKAAYDVLADAEQRQIYEAEHPPPSGSGKRLEDLPTRRSRGGAQAVAQTKLDREKAERLEKRRQEILERRKKNAGQPFQDRAKLAKEFFDKGMAYLADKNTVGAADAFRLALTYAPNNEEYQRRYDDLAELAGQEKAKAAVKEGEAHLGHGDTASAAEAFAKASDLAPRMASHALRAAQAYLDCANHEKALHFARRAVKVSPRRFEARLLAAKIHVARQEKNAAIAELEIAVTLDRSDTRAKKMLKGLLR